MGISIAVGSNGGGRLQGYQGLKPKYEEHGCAIYCNTTDN